MIRQVALLMGCLWSAMAACPFVGFLQELQSNHQNQLEPAALLIVNQAVIERHSSLAEATHMHCCGAYLPALFIPCMNNDRQLQHCHDLLHSCIDAPPGTGGAFLCCDCNILTQLASQSLSHQLARPGTWLPTCGLGGEHGICKNSSAVGEPLKLWQGLAGLEHGSCFLR